MNPIIVTNAGFAAWPEWSARTRVVAASPGTRSASDPHRVPRSRFRALRAAWELFRHRREADCYLVLADLTGFLLSALLRTWPGRRPPVFFTATIWTWPRFPLERGLRRAMFRYIRPAIRRIFVHSRVEIENYHRVFGLPRELFRFVPFCHQLTGYDYEVRDDGYVWAGGNGDRDYRTFIEAVRPLRVPVLINATRQELFTGIDIPPHVTIRGTTPEGFRRNLAACRVAVVPMEGGKLHPGGQQTYLAAMAMGKPVIVTDPAGGRDYIDDGRDGILVEPGDVEGLRRSLEGLLEDPDLRVRMGRHARERAAGMTEEWRGTTLLAIIEEELSRQEIHH